MFIKKYEITNIEWDTDGEDISLPQQIDVFVPNKVIDASEIHEYISNKITEKTGFCHKGFNTNPEINY